MATPISSHEKDNSSIFTAHNFLVKGKILVFHQYLYNKKVYFFSWQPHCNFFFSWKLEWAKQVSARENCLNDTCVLSVIVCKNFHNFDWSWSCKTISFWVKAVEFIFVVGFLTKIALKCLWMILDFGKLKNNCISCSCIFRKSISSQIILILCNSVHQF